MLLMGASESLSEGAIAVGKAMPRQWFGVSINRSSLQEARNDAIAACSRSGPNCSVFTTFRNACVAITWGETRGRAGYAATTQATIDDARSAAISNCYSHGMSRCEIRYAACDTVDEAAIARERRLQEQRAAEEAIQRQREAELALQRAKQERERLNRQAEEEARQRAREELAKRPAEAMRPKLEPPSSSKQDSQSGISNKKALGFGIAFIVGVFIVILKQGNPQLAGWTAIIMPVVSFIAYVTFGIELKDEVTLAEWPLFAPLFGGMIVAAISWKLHS